MTLTREINIVTENKESNVVAKGLRLIPWMHNDMADQDILDRVSTETLATVGIRRCVVLSQPNSPPADTSNRIKIVALNCYSHQVLDKWLNFGE